MVHFQWSKIVLNVLILDNSSFNLIITLSPDLATLRLIVETVGGINLRLPCWLPIVIAFWINFTKPSSKLEKKGIFN